MTHSCVPSTHNPKTAICILCGKSMGREEVQKTIQVTGETVQNLAKTIHELEVFTEHAKYRLRAFKGVLHITQPEIEMLDVALAELKKGTS